MPLCVTRGRNRVNRVYLKYLTSKTHGPICAFAIERLRDREASFLYESVPQQTSLGDGQDAMLRPKACGVTNAVSNKLCGSL